MTDSLLADGAMWFRVLSLQDYNTRLVVIATTLLGLAAGIVGSFTLLRKRALLGDALSHATLPGIALAFLIAPAFALPGKSLPLLLAGAAVSGSIGVLSILAIRNLTKLKEDAALGIVLSVFFGGGLTLLGIAQQTPEGHAAGLESFIYGKTASIIAQDAWWIVWAAAGSLALLALIYKEMKLLCFDDAFAASRGYPTVLLDVALMAMVVWVTIVGLQAVGLVLMIALLVIPAAAARFWTSNLLRMTLLAGVLGSVACMIGSVISALAPRLPSGAMIVLTSATFFLVSMLIGRQRGVVIQAWRRWTTRRRIDRRHVLRGVYELVEPQVSDPQGDLSVAGVWASTKTLHRSRTWSLWRMKNEILRLCQDGMLRCRDGEVTLTTAGLVEARRLTREHRMWELYLITHADVATDRVDQDAERIEDCLEPVMIEELEGLLERSLRGSRVPVSPHQMELSPSESGAPS